MALLVCVPVLALGVTACANATKATTATAGAARRPPAVARELAYLASAQNPDGGFGAAPGLHSAELYSAWAAMGVAAAGRSPLAMRRNGHTVLDAIVAEAGTLNGAGDLERTILALHACGVSVRSLPGGDPVKRLLGFRARDGSFGGLSNLTAFGIFALRAAGYTRRSPVVVAAGRWLARQQNPGGGFGFATRGGGSDVDDTAAAMQALAAAAPARPAALARSLTYLRHAQNLDGGYPQETGGASDAQSTAWAVQALLVAGEDPAKVHRGGSAGPLAYLQSLVLPDGSVRYSRTGAQTPVWVTAQALTALAGRPLPISPPVG